MTEETGVMSFASFMETLLGSAVQEYVTPISLREGCQTELTKKRIHKVESYIRFINTDPYVLKII